jgi:hypothetical protein
MNKRIPGILERMKRAAGCIESAKPHVTQPTTTVLQMERLRYWLSQSIGLLQFAYDESLRVDMDVKRRNED